MASTTSALNNNNSSPAVEAYLFDMDGTVMDSHEVWDRALNEMSIAHRGAPMSAHEAAVQIGWSMEEVLDIMFPKMDAATFRAEIEEGFIKHAHTAKLLEGAEAMVRAAVKNSTSGRTALVTNCPYFLTRHLIARNAFLSEAFGDAIYCAWDPLVPAVAAALGGSASDASAASGGSLSATSATEISSDASNCSPVAPNVAAQMVLDAAAAQGAGRSFDASLVPSKPSPVMLQLAANRLGVNVQRCVMVGDAINDAKAGANAGCCATIGINWAAGESIAGASYNTSSLGEVTAVIERLATADGAKQ